MGNLEAEKLDTNSKNTAWQLAKTIPFFQGVQEAVLFALEHPEADNPFTPEKESQLVIIIDSLVEMSESFNFNSFMPKVKELMALSEII